MTTLLSYNLGLVRLTPLDFTWVKFFPKLEAQLRQMPERLAQYNINNRAMRGVYKAFNFLDRDLWSLAPHVEERQAEAAAALRRLDADIVCLQEIYGENPRQELFSALKDVYPHQAVNPQPKRMGTDDGLMVLSKYPILDIKFVPFIQGPPLEKALGDKGYLACQIDASDLGRISLFNCHLTAGAPMHKTNDPITEKWRSQQIRQMLKDVDAVIGSNPLIVGDFNCGPECSFENYRELLLGGYSDLFARAINDRQIDNLPSYDANNPLNAHCSDPSMRIDHFFVRAKTAHRWTIAHAWRVGEEAFVPVGGELVPLSDHYGLMLDMVKTGASWLKRDKPSTAPESMLAAE